MPNCGPPYCYDFMIYMGPGPLNYDLACQNAARSYGYPQPQDEYSCSVQVDGSGYDNYCCLYGG
jgi:hypothetical protein